MTAQNPLDVNFSDLYIQNTLNQTNLFGNNNKSSNPYLINNTGVTTAQKSMQSSMMQENQDNVSTQQSQKNFNSSVQQSNLQHYMKPDNIVIETYYTNQDLPTAEQLSNNINNASLDSNCVKAWKEVNRLEMTSSMLENIKNAHAFRPASQQGTKHLGPSRRRFNNTLYSLQSTKAKSDAGKSGSRLGGARKLARNLLQKTAFDSAQKTRSETVEFGHRRENLAPSRLSQIKQQYHSTHDSPGPPVHKLTVKKRLERPKQEVQLHTLERKPVVWRQALKDKRNKPKTAGFNHQIPPEKKNLIMKAQINIQKEKLRGMKNQSPQGVGVMSPLSHHKG